MRKRYFFILIFLSCLLSAPRTSLWAQNEIQLWQAEDTGRLREVLGRGNYLVFRADTVLTPDSAALDKDLVFVGCKAAVDRPVHGSVVVLDGELGLRWRSRVSGDVFLVRGTLFQSRRAEVGGKICRTTAAEVYRVVIDNLGDAARGVPLRLEFQTNRMGGFLLEGYDRVDGFSVSWGFKLIDPDFKKSPLIEARLITATTRQAFGFDSRLELPLDKQRRYVFGVAGRSLTDTNDRWRLADLENSVKAFLFGYDYRYYFKREGYGVYFRRTYGKRSSLSLSWNNERYYSLKNLSPFTLLAQETFAPNLPVSSGPINSLVLSGVLDTRDDEFITREGFRITAEGEIAGGRLGGQRSFSRFDIEIKRWDTFFKRHHTFLWGKVAGSDRSLPFQRCYTLGNTLRAYNNFDFSGDRLLMAQASYGYEMPGLPVLDYLFFDWCPQVVFETGNAYFRTAPGGRYGDLKSDLGLGVCGRTLLGQLAVHWFRNLDGADIDARIRISLDMNIFE